MSNLVISAALPEDLLEVARSLRGRDRVGIQATGREPGEAWAIECLASGARVYTLLEAGYPIACAGFSPERPGVLGVWLVAVREFDRRYARMLVREGRRLLAAHLRNEAVHRLETTCLASWGSAARFLEALGWRAEGLHRRAGANGEDFISWAIVKE
jgi:RimJ/RimL family protein N-acetyltransferase